MKYAASFAARDTPLLSPPVRGAWVEISKSQKCLSPVRVAPCAGGRGLKYSVSRITCRIYTGRPLCGGRGLKSGPRG